MLTECQKVSHQIKNSNYGDDYRGKAMNLNVKGDEEEMRLERVILWVSTLFEGQDKFNPSLLISLS